MTERERERVPVEWSGDATVAMGGTHKGVHGIPAPWLAGSRRASREQEVEHDPQNEQHAEGS